MVILPKPALLGFVLFCLLVPIALAVLGSVLLDQAAQDGVAKAKGETLFFVALLGFLLVALAALLLARSARRRKKVALRLFRRNSWAGLPHASAALGPAARSREWTAALGELGQQIVDYTGELSDLNQARALKINGMHALLVFITRNSPEVLGIVNMEGVLVYGSADFHRIMEAAGKENIHKLPIVSRRELGHLAAELERSHQSLTQKIGSLDYQVYAINDRRHEIAYIAFLLMDRSYETFHGTPEAAEPAPSAPVAAAKSFTGKIRHGVARLFKR